MSWPTRITKSTATLIDNILVSQNLLEKYNCNVLLDNISDHLPCVMSLSGMNLAKSEPITIISRDMREQNLKALVCELSDVDWSDIMDEEDVNLSTNRVHECLVSKIDHHLPLRTREIQYKMVRREPWVSAGLLHCINRSKKLYSQSIRHDSTEKDCLVYKDYTRSLSKILRENRTQQVFNHVVACV